MAETLMNLYLKRLQSLSETVSYLHEIVEVDEALALLKDEKLVQYKMDRIAQLVREVLTSEKEKIIIQLILNIEAMQHKLQTKELKSPAVDQTQLIYYRKRLEQKSQEIQRLKTQAHFLRQQHEGQKKVANELKIQFELYQNKYKEIKEKWEKFEQLKKLEIETDSYKIEEVTAKTTKFEQQLQRQRKINQQAQMEKNQLRTTIDNLKQEIQSVTSQLQQNKQFSCKQKTAKIEILKKEVKKLSNDLNEMKQMTRIILDYIDQSLSTQLNCLKRQLSKLSSYISSELRSIVKDTQNSYEQALKNIITKDSDAREDDEMMKRMQKLEGELCKFIEANQI